MTSRSSLSEEFIAERGADLTAERDRLRAHVARLEEEAALALEEAEGDTSFDEEGGEGASAAVDADQRRALAASARAALVEVEEALARIEAGTYGLCRSCGRPIAEARLEALPAASTCVACKASGLLG